MGKRKRISFFIISVIAGVLLLVIYFGLPAQAAGFVENVIDDSHLYSRYDLSNYQLDFYVDTSGGWLPWNWGESIGQSVMYGIYALTNVFWLLSCLLAQGAGYIIQQAFELDFVGDMAGSVGKNIQTLAGISPSGFSSDGFYVGCLLLLIVVVGIYVLYVGAFKRETTKALSAVTSFLIIFILSACLIAYAPESISNVNDFSKDMTSSAMDLGLRIMGDETGTDGTTGDSSATIRDVLWKIQVDVPWELLQFGSVGEVESERVEGLKAVSPDEEGGKTREDVVKSEVEQGNMNVSMPRVMSRLGEMLFIFTMSLLISIFVLLLAGFMMFSQMLFIIYATYLPISFLLSMVPGFNGIAKNAVLSLFNTILQRVGITLVVVITFSISYLLYQSIGAYPFLLVMFVQIVIFIGVFLALPELLRKVTLPTSGGEQRTVGLARQVAAVMMMRGGGKRGSGGKKPNQKGNDPSKDRGKPSGASDGSGSNTGTSSNRTNTDGAGGSDMHGMSGTSRSSQNMNQEMAYNESSSENHSASVQDKTSDTTKTQHGNGNRKVMGDVEPMNEIEKYKNKEKEERDEQGAVKKPNRENVSGETDKKPSSVEWENQSNVGKDKEGVRDKGSGKAKSEVKDRGNISDNSSRKNQTVIQTEEPGNNLNIREKETPHNIEELQSKQGGISQKNRADGENQDITSSRKNVGGIRDNINLKAREETRQQGESYTKEENNKGGTTEKSVSYRENQEVVSKRTSVLSSAKERRMVKKGQDIEPAREIRENNQQKTEEGEKKHR